MPGWNVLSLFDVRHVHSVTYVAPFAGRHGCPSPGSLGPGLAEPGLDLKYLGFTPPPGIGRGLPTVAAAHDDLHVAEFQRCFSVR